MVIRFTKQKDTYADARQENLMKEKTNGISSHRGVIRFVKFLNVVIMTALFGSIWYLFLYGKVYTSFFFGDDIAIILLYAILYCLYGRTYEGFLISYSRISQMLYSQMLALCMSDFLMLVLTFFMVRDVYSPLPYILLLGLQTAAAAGWCVAAHRWYFRTFPPKKTIIIWDMRKGLKRLIAEKGLDRKFEVIADYQAYETCKNPDVLSEADCVFIIGVHSHQRNKIIKYCEENHIVSFIIPRVGDVLMGSAKQVHLFHLPMLRLQRYNPPPEYLAVKRIFDVVVSIIGLVILSPVYLFFAIWIRKEDGGPVLYKQVRLTKDGKQFYVLKFRSMRVDAEKDGVARLSTGENDGRITRVGKIMRAHRIDELPQLINILKGDMSIVGPRPERPEIAAQYERELPEFRLRLQCKCGLTGYAQVYGKYNTMPYDKLLMDLMYIANASVAQDLSIIFATVKILFTRESTEGVEAGRETAQAEINPKPEDMPAGRLNQSRAV